MYTGGARTCQFRTAREAEMYTGGEFINLRPPPLYLPAPNARSSECSVYCSVLVVVEVNVIMGAGMDSVVVDVVEVNVIMGAGMHSLVSDFAVNNSNLAVVEVFIRML